MRIYRSLAEVPADFGPSVLTIGNFDGVHFGHRRILRRLKALAGERGWKPAVLTFDPHPTRIVAPEHTPRLMTSPDRRAELMREEGIEHVLILPFTRELALLTPEEFVRQLLVERLGARAVLVAAISASATGRRAISGCSRNWRKGWASKRKWCRRPRGGAASCRAAESAS